VDPIVGGRIYFDFSDKLKASLRGDVGGFGIGTASELTWMVSAIGEYKFNPNVGLVFGYRYLDLDWSQGSGTGLVAFDLTIHGPIIGIDIAF
jgi:hypothetical protein